MRSQSSTIYALAATALTITSVSALEPGRNNGGYLAGGSKTAYRAGIDSPDGIEPYTMSGDRLARSLDIFDDIDDIDNNDVDADNNDESSNTNTIQWPAVLYVYTGIVYHNVLRRTKLGRDFAADDSSDLGTTLVECFCAQGSMCSCEENGDVKYWNAIITSEEPAELEGVYFYDLDVVGSGIVYVNGSVTGEGSGVDGGGGLLDVSEEEEEEEEDDDDEDIGIDIGSDDSDEDFFEDDSAFEELEEVDEDDFGLDIDPGSSDLDEDIIDDDDDDEDEDDDENIAEASNAASAYVTLHLPGWSLAIIAAALWNALS